MTIGVIGLGYVGLPLVVEFAEAGEHVVAVDIDETKVAGVEAGTSYIEDIPSERLRAIGTRCSSFWRRLGNSRRSGASSDEHWAARRRPSGGCASRAPFPPAGPCLRERLYFVALSVSAGALAMVGCSLICPISSVSASARQP